MKLRNSGAEIFIPDGKPVNEAIGRTTHMAISAHQDDVEIMAYDGIQECFGKEDAWFFAVVVTNGAGSPRNGLYAAYTDDRMQKVRKQEQKKAAFVGEYGAAAMLDYTSAAVKTPGNTDVVEELRGLIALARPRVIYTHNLADKHNTHIATVTKVIHALRGLPQDLLPEKVYGCEVWRSLDWLNDDEKVSFDVSARPNIASALVEIFDSQICGGKRYDLATTGRRLANATYSADYQTDRQAAVSYAMDLTPLVVNKDVDMIKYIVEHIDRFSRDVADRLRRILG